MFFRRAFLTLLFFCCFQPFYAAAADGVSFFGAWPCGNNGTSACVLTNSLEITAGNVYLISTDTGISRDSAGVFDFGNGTAGNKSGTGQAAVFNAGTGFQIAGGAPTGHYLRGNGGSPANYVDSTIPTADLPLPAIVGSMYNTSQYTNATTGLTTISTSPTISAGWLIYVDCQGTYSVTGTAEKFGVALTAGQTAQNMDYGAVINYSAAAGSGSVGFTGTSTTGATALVGGGVVSSTSSVYPFHITGRILWNASTNGTFTLQAESGNAAGTVTINAYNSSCLITRLL